MHTGQRPTLLALLLWHVKLFSSLGFDRERREDLRYLPSELVHLLKANIVFITALLVDKLEGLAHELSSL